MVRALSSSGGSIGRLTAIALAELPGVGAAYLSELEAGMKAGSVAALGRIAAVLGLSSDDLV